MQSINPSPAEKQAARWLLLAYCGFVIYGSFIPFRFTFDPRYISWRWWRFFFAVVQGELNWISTADVLSNVLLYIPLGALWVWTGAAIPRQRGAGALAIATGLFGFLLGLAVECGQTLSPYRNPSLLDALCNGAGALLGAVAGLLLARRFQGSVERNLAGLLQNRRSALALGYLLFGIVMHSFFPFDVTLNLAIIGRNLKQSQLIPFQYGFPPLRSILFIELLAIYFALGYLVAIELKRRRGGGAGRAWLLTSALALAVETAKLFFPGHPFRSGNLLIACTASGLGILVSAKIYAWSWVGRHMKGIAFTLVLAFLLYFELAPFDWISLSELPSRLGKIEWLPFKSYYGAEPLRVIFDLEKKLYYSMPLGYIALALTAGRRGRAALLCGAIAAALEGAQLVIRSRTPALTDVIVFSAGAWLGILLFQLSRRNISNNDRR